MNKCFLAVTVSALSLISTLAFAQVGDNDTPPLTASQTAQAKAELRAAQAKWASMTPEQRADVSQQMRFKRLEYLSALEAYSDNDMQALTADETSELKLMREEARRRWASMSLQEKTAMKKLSRQKMLQQLTTLERVAGAGS